VNGNMHDMRTFVLTTINHRGTVEALIAANHRSTPHVIMYCYTAACRRLRTRSYIDLARYVRQVSRRAAVALLPVGPTIASGLSVTSRRSSVINDALPLAAAAARDRR